MGEGILDTLTATFVASLDQGFAVLLPTMLGLLSLLAVLKYYPAMGEVLAGGAGTGDALAMVLWTAIKLGVWVYLVTHWQEIWLAALNTFVQWGLAPAGGVFTLDAFLHPSKIIDSGYVVARPIQQTVDMMAGWATLWNAPKIWQYSAAWYLILFSFVGLAFLTAIAIIEFHLALMISPVLFPWGVLLQTASLSELSLSWLVAGVVRMLVMSGLMSIAVPLFVQITVLPNPAADRDPTIREAFTVAVGALFFLLITGVASNRAAGLAGRGMALAMGSEVYAPIWRYASAAASATIRGTSRLLEPKRA
jgi:type IV secretory pathway TrbL component